MVTTYKYRLLNRPTARLDGTGYVQHDIQGIRDIDGDDEVIPGYHSSANIHSDDVETVMDMPDSTGPERALKNQAYKDIIGPAIGYTPSPGTRDWSKDGMEVYSDTNDAAGVEADRIDMYITVTLAQSYPVDFSLIL